MTVTKVKIITKDGKKRNAIYIHDDHSKVHIFIDKLCNIYLEVEAFLFTSGTPIITI